MGKTYRRDDFFSEKNKKEMARQKVKREKEESRWGKEEDLEEVQDNYDRSYKSNKR